MKYSNLKTCWNCEFHYRKWLENYDTYLHYCFNNSVAIQASVRVPKLCEHCKKIYDEVSTTK